MKMLSVGGRLTLVKSVLGSMPIFYMSMFKAPAGILKSLESMRSHFLNGHDSASGKVIWLSWKKVITPRDKGGLGVASLFALNRGLMFKWVWRFLNQGSSLWARVIKAIHGIDGNIGRVPRDGYNSCWSNIVKEVKYLSEKGIDLMKYLCIRVGNGGKTSLWEDIWRVDGRLRDKFPRIYALESCKSITIGDKLAQPSLQFSFRRMPRGGVEQEQYELFVQEMQQIILTSLEDRWSWCLNGSGEYTVASVRSLIDDTLCMDYGQRTRWNEFVPIKVNTHVWKVMTNSLATRFNLSRRGIDIASISCGTCDQGVETVSHLFFRCDMAQQVRRLINRWWMVPDLVTESFEDWRIWVSNIRMGSKTKKMFEGVYYVAWWLLWMFRNKKLFEVKGPSKATFFDDVVSRSFYGVVVGAKSSSLGTTSLRIGT
uniref:RNA-directed DNA polymerase, eukaryota, reverse transcriptase zinc-binding domain protein n=1 Tax=Tanacetum cinerariifolium TaxID=118510 RepID=A0A6L2JIE9_TANCI|nr:RNA-directed DNA polymerase, eukaryota, reverse transcriptase zinc-binding domain protein [Tanacetum cinerariifolium]